MQVKLLGSPQWKDLLFRPLLIDNSLVIFLVCKLTSRTISPTYDIVIAKSTGQSLEESSAFHLGPLVPLTVTSLAPPTCVLSLLIDCSIFRDQGICWFALIACVYISKKNFLQNLYKNNGLPRFSNWQFLFPPPSPPPPSCPNGRRSPLPLFYLLCCW